PTTWIRSRMLLWTRQSAQTERPTVTLVIATVKVPGPNGTPELTTLAPASQGFETSPHAAGAPSIDGNSAALFPLNPPSSGSDTMNEYGAFAACAWSSTHALTSVPSGRSVAVWNPSMWHVIVSPIWTFSVGA